MKTVYPLQTKFAGGINTEFRNNPENFHPCAYESARAFYVKYGTSRL